MQRLTWILCALALIGNSRTAFAGWPFFSDDGLRRGTPEWYEAHAGDPPGIRQRYRFGKLWPPIPRPDGPEQLLVHRYHTAHYWPLPYQCDDRDIVRQYMDTQMYNGWMAGTTLYDHHFDPATHELNSAGREHLIYIISQAPTEHRTAYVATSAGADVQQTRIHHVQQELAQLAGESQPVSVLARTARQEGRPAVEVKTILDAALSNMPAPTIIYKSASSE